MVKEGVMVSRAKVALATLFDVIGITEQMDATLVSVAKLLDVPNSVLPAKGCEAGTRRSPYLSATSW